MSEKEKAIVKSKKKLPVKRTPAKPTEFNPSQLLQMAISKDLDIDKLEKLVAMQERWEEKEAKKAFVSAMAEFKKDPPKIEKDSHVKYNTSKGVTEYNYACLANVVEKITEQLSKCNLSANWRTEQKEGLITVTCKITHIKGYSEETTISAKPDASGGKNEIQAVGSTITYLQRYTILAATGLATNEFETDGKSKLVEKPSRVILNLLMKNSNNEGEIAKEHFSKILENAVVSYPKIFKAVRELKDINQENFAQFKIEADKYFNSIGG